MNPVEFRAVRVACGLSAKEAADDVIAMGLCNPGSKRKSVLGRISAAKCNKIASAYGYQWR